MAARLLGKADLTRIMWLAAGGYQQNTGGVRVDFTGEHGCCAKSNGAGAGAVDEYLGAYTIWRGYLKYSMLHRSVDHTE